MDTVSIAVLITCHNRRDTTLACLDALMAQDLPEHVRVQVYVVDDGCTDGTPQEVAARFPEVNILRGDGGLYWCGGMRLAFDEAIKADHDHYVWLNDDVKLFPEAIRTLLDAAQTARQHTGRAGIIVGSLRDPETGRHTYGGRIRPYGWAPLRFRRVPPTDESQPCDVLAGNLVLVPRDIARDVGNLSNAFTHSMGDADYGFRAQAAGYTCWIAPGYLGACAFHPLRSSYRDPQLPLRKRFQLLSTPTSPCHPAREWMVFAKRHAGLLWPIEWLRVRLLNGYLPALFPRLRLLWRKHRPL